RELPLTPDHHAPAAVLSLGNGSLERVVLDRVILDLHREPLDRRVEARPLRPSPALHHAIELEPQVEVQVARGVLLDDIRQLGGRLAPSASWLGGAVEI